MSLGFDPLPDDPQCRVCIGLDQLARRRGHRLAFVDETSDLFPCGVRVYLHPIEACLETMTAVERECYRGQWFAACPRRCAILGAFDLASPR